jgi:hypothetical protein
MTAKAAFSAFRSAIWMFRSYSLLPSPAENENAVLGPLHARRDRAEGKFFLTGYTEFPEEEDIEGSTQRPRNFERDGYAAAGNSKHNDIIPVGILFKPPSKAPAGFRAICKNHGYLL